MIEYYITMIIFAIIILGMGYFIYKWYEITKNLKVTITEVSEGVNSSKLSIVTLANLNEPCVLKTKYNINDPYEPFCDESFGLTCVTGMFEGNGDGNSGICLSDIGQYCTTLYDCVPYAKACINNSCENLSETINSPCNFDSDCIGEPICTVCESGTGPCKNSSGVCTEMVNGKCLPNYIPCDENSGPYEGNFMYSHICDTSLDIPKCKYNFSPKDQGCSVDLDCFQPEGGSFCYTGSFKTVDNLKGEITAPTYNILSIIDSDGIAVLKIDFEQTLLTSKSFETGTEVNFIAQNADSFRTTVHYGPFYVRDHFGNSEMTLMKNKLQPDIAEYIRFPTKYIQLNESSYTKGESVLYEDVKKFDSSDFNIVFGVLPPMNIKTSCYYTTTPDGAGFKILDEDKSFKLINNGNVQEKGPGQDGTQVRFNIVSNGARVDINSAKPFYLNKISGTGDDAGLFFTVLGDNLDSLKDNNSESSPLLVMFGKPNQPDLLDNNTGICVPKLPPSASIITDGKYDLTNYKGSPCIDLFDNSREVKVINNFCSFENNFVNAGAACQFERDKKTGKVNPLPCNKFTENFEGINYTLTCLINDDLTETMKTNINFLNSSYSGICSFPVYEKFQICQPYGNNCIPPYVCTGFQGGTFCDSSFDLFNCNKIYGCPETFKCDSGVCKGITGQGFCVSNDNCISEKCGEKQLFIGFYNSAIDTIADNIDSMDDSKIKNRIVNLGILTSISGSASDYKLFLKSLYNTNGSLTTYIIATPVLNGTLKTSIITVNDPLSKIRTQTSILLDLESDYNDFIFITSSTGITIWGWYQESGILNMKKSTFNNSTSATLQFTIQDDIQNIDSLGEDLLITTYSETNNYRVEFINLNVQNEAQKYIYSVIKIKNFESSSVQENYPIPYFSEALDELLYCKFDNLNVNNTELDFICTHRSEKFSNPTLGVRHNVREYNKSNGTFTSLDITNPSCNSAEKDIGCFLDPVISEMQLLESDQYPTFLKDNTSYTITIDEENNLYKITDKYDINTIYGFSGFDNLKIEGKNIVKIYKSENNLYIETENAIASSSLTNLTITFDKTNIDFVPFSFSKTSNVDNYGNTLSKYLEYPFWIEDLEDLVIGDNYNPDVRTVFYVPNRTNTDYYTIVNMFTGYENNPAENNLIINEVHSLTINNTFMFKFSSNDNESGLLVDETIPIKINGPDDINRFAQCNETQNMFFISNQCVA